MEGRKDLVVATSAGGEGEGILNEGFAERVTSVIEISLHVLQEPRESGDAVAQISFTRDSVKLDPSASDGNGADLPDTADRKT